VSRNPTNFPDASMSPTSETFEAAISQTIDRCADSTLILNDFPSLPRAKPFLQIFRRS
jgi:hypothetical protein